MSTRIALIILLSTAIALASGCALFEGNAGSSHYVYERTDPDGTVHRVDLENRKNIGLVSANLEYKGVKLELLEQGVDASGPMQTMAESNKALVDALLTKVPVP